MSSTTPAAEWKAFHAIGKGYQGFLTLVVIVSTMVMDHQPADRTLAARQLRHAAQQ
jgi:hypothetical protein